VLALLTLCGADAGTSPTDDRLARLLDATADADTLVVRDGGLCHRDLASERVLVTVRDPAEVRALTRLIELDDVRGLHCLCCGRPTLEFFRAGELVAAVTIHHGLSLRSLLWGSDNAFLTPASARAFTDHLAALGVPGPRNERTQGPAASP
jgi:hypothetical protein